LWLFLQGIHSITGKDLCNFNTSNSLGMIARLVPAAVFKTVEDGIPILLGSIPRRSRKREKLGYPNFINEKILFMEYIFLLWSSFKSAE